MKLSDLEKKVARLVPRRLLRSALGQVVEAEVKRRDEAQIKAESAGQVPQQSLPKPATGRAQRIPQAQPEQPTASVSDLELRPAELEPGARDVRERLLQRGASAALADRIVRGVVAAGARGAFAIDAAAEEMSRVFRFEASPRSAAAPHILFFVGPTGSGKTSTMAKLGRKLGAAGRKVFYATLDPLSASSLSGTVGSDIDRTELPLAVISDAKDLQSALRRALGTDLILVDTPGYSPRDEKGLEDLAVTIDQVAQLGTPRVYLVLPASASRSSLGMATRAFACTGPTAAVITKLDETTEPGVALEESQHARLPLGFLCDGQDVRSNLTRATPDHVADLYLRGSLS